MELGSRLWTVGSVVWRMKKTVSRAGSLTAVSDGASALTVVMYLRIHPEICYPHMLQLMSIFPRDTFMMGIVHRLSPEDQWRLRCSSKTVSKFMYNWHDEHNSLLLSMKTVLEMMCTLQIKYAINCPMNKRLYEMVFERLMYNSMRPLRRWMRENRIGVDEGGLYTRISATQRVRVGMWETGVVFLPPRYSPNMSQARKRMLAKTVKFVLRDGYEIYAE